MLFDKPQIFVFTWGNGASICIAEILPLEEQIWVVKMMFASAAFVVVSCACSLMKKKRPQK
jgi:hypothetical protein